MTDSSFRRFAVVGNPSITACRDTLGLAAQMGRDIDYRAELVAIDSFETWVATFLSGVVLVSTLLCL